MNFSVPETSLPDGWQVTHIISLDPEWQVNLRSEDHVAIGTGDTILEAISNASHKAMNEEFSSQLFHLSHFLPKAPTAPSLTLASLLPLPGLSRSPVKRRKV